MSYSPTLASIKNNTSSENVATPLKTRYNEELMFYVYQQVVEAIEARKEPESNDLNSIILIKEAKNRTLYSLTSNLFFQEGVRASNV